jgi:hypothetical protein
MSRKIKKWTWANVALMSCIVACICDMFSVPVFARFYPEYNPVSQPISVLGAAGSPIARFVSWWWIFIGLLFLLFALAYALSNHLKQPAQNLAAWLIGIYATGEQIGSGLFPGNHLAGHLTAIGWVHNMLGGAGMAALMVLPLVLLKKFTLPEFPLLHRFCIIITAVGVIIFLGFTISHISVFTGHRFAQWHGLWQRLWVANYYVFLMVIAAQLVLEKRRLKSISY